MKIAEASCKNQLAKVISISSKIAHLYFIMNSNKSYFYERIVGKTSYGPLNMDETRHVWYEID